MISYFDMGRKPIQDAFRNFLEGKKCNLQKEFRGPESDRFGVPESIFFDSGAFSMRRENPAFFEDFKKGSPLLTYLDRYAAFMKELAEVPNLLMANVDVIGNPKLTWRNQKYFEKEFGLFPIPVVHCPASDDEYPKALEWLDFYLERDYELIGLGGFVGKGREVKRRWCREAFDRICPESNKRLPLKKVHGFAMFDYELLFGFPWWSVDSTTWGKPANIGWVYMPQPPERKGKWDLSKPYDKVNFSTESPQLFKEGVSRHFERLDTDSRRKVEGWLKEIGSESFAMSALSDHRAEANLQYWIRLQEIFPEWPYPYDPEKTQKEEKATANRSHTSQRKNQKPKAQLSIG